ncbi:M48 family metallopeptidase [Candidatus Woesearchaeota archaeon]|nr:M48 family metallopeptidase [Candidatus Woesearchaeota archaeon]
MNLAERAFFELFPEKKLSKAMGIKYSRAFNAYNANARYTALSMTFRLSYDWKKVSDEIKIGLIQHLLVKIYKEKKNTINMDLYENFIRKIGDYSEVTQADPLLEQSFTRVNDKYFNGFLPKPNLRWGSQSFSKLGCYEYGSNTVTISSIFNPENSKGKADDEKAKELLDYIMYHELLHKKHKFKSKNGKNYHHTRKFRQQEKAFENPNIEKELKHFLAKKQVKRAFTFNAPSANARKRKKRSFWDFF